jgi:hypothetical protein
VAQFTFVLKCPPDVKEYKFATAYVDAEERSGTTATVRLWFGDVLDDYMRNRDEERETIPEWDRARYPDQLEGFFSTLVVEVYEAMDPEITQPTFTHAEDPEEKEYSGDPLYEPQFSFVTGMGTVNVHRVAVEVWAGRRTFKAFTDAFFNAASLFRSDVLRLRYLALDRSHPRSRLVATVAYVSGFILLGLPAADTLIRIVAQVARRVAG